MQKPFIVTMGDKAILCLPSIFISNKCWVYYIEGHLVIT